MKYMDWPNKVLINIINNIIGVKMRGVFTIQVAINENTVTYQNNCPILQVVK